MKQPELTCDCNFIHEECVNFVKEHFLPEDTFVALADFFKVLGDPTRVKIIYALDQKELCVCDLACVLNMTKSAVSHQLALLRNSHLVKSRRDGKTVYYSLSDDHVKLLFEAGLDHVNE